jgi:GNAT superfamily N-acetyltransferase
MLFANTSLAARIERAECRSLTAGAQAVARRRAGAGVAIMPLAGGVAVFTVDGSPLNKVAGLGFGGPLPEREIEAVEATFAARGKPVQVELSCLAEPAIGEQLTRRGYVLRGYENVLGRRLPAEAAPPLGAGIAIAASGPDEMAAWIDVTVTGFATPDEDGVPSHEVYEREVIEPIIADVASADGFVFYLARCHGVPAGSAGMRLSEGIAQLCGAATLPSHRRRGVHSALLAARLADASDAGCDVAVVTALPGSKSHENAQRKGFELLYTRAILVRG